MRDLSEKINEAAVKIRAGSTWRHFKGGIYRVNAFCIMTETGEVGVLYSRVDGPNFDPAEAYISFVRPYREWFEDVDTTAGGFVPRFKKVQKVERWMTEEEAKLPS